MATKCLACSCLQCRGVNATVILKSKNKKSICKVKIKKCERGESSSNIPPIHTGASPGRQDAPVVLIPRLGWVPPNSHFGDAGWQEPFQPQGQKWGLSSAPYAHSPQAHLTGNRHLRFKGCQTPWSAKSHLKSIFHHHEPCKVLATSCVCSCKNHSGAQLCLGCRLTLLQAGDTSLTHKLLPVRQ